MDTTRRRLPWLSRFALLIAWAMAVVPTLSHALAWADGRGSSALEVCTAEGMRWVDAVTGQVTDAAPETSDRIAHSLEHCPYCHAQGAWAVMPAPVSAVLLANALSQPVPERFLQAPRTAHAWCSAQPRAPPSLT